MFTFWKGGVINLWGFIIIQMSLAAAVTPHRIKSLWFLYTKCCCIMNALLHGWMLIPPTSRPLLPKIIFQWILWNSLTQYKQILTLWEQIPCHFNKGFHCVGLQLCNRHISIMMVVSPVICKPSNVSLLSIILFLAAALNSVWLSTYTSHSLRYLRNSFSSHYQG